MNTLTPDEAAEIMDDMEGLGAYPEDDEAMPLDGLGMAYQPGSPTGRLAAKIRVLRTQVRWRNAQLIKLRRQVAALKRAAPAATPATPAA